MTGKFTTYKCGDFTFASRYWSNSQAWGHECYLLQDGIGEVAKERYRYYNRTWECYTFQSVMDGAVDNYRKKELERYLNNVKLTLGLRGWDSETGEFDKPWPRGAKKKAIEEFEATDTAKQINRLTEFVKNRE